MFAYNHCTIITGPITPLSISIHIFKTTYSMDDDMSTLDFNYIIQDNTFEKYKNINLIPFHLQL